MEHKIKKLEILILVSAMALYSFLALFAPSGIWNSPDESANAFFIERFSSGGGLTVFDPDIVRSNGLIHPRSISVIDELLVPGSFIGMILFYSAPAKFFSSSVLPFLTPFFAALGLIAFGRILQRFFGARIAVIGTFLAMLHPALWYYANRGLFHNVFFLDCVIFAFYFAIVRPFPRVSDLLAASAFILALATRTFEAIWLLPLALIVLFINRKKIARETFFVYGIIFLFAGALMFFISKTVYGSFLPSGYPRIELLPFGFSLRNMARNGIWYGRLFFWWYTLIAGAGIIYLIYLKIKARAPTALWHGLLALFLVSLPLFIIYGSGAYLDTPDPRQITIGNSVIRYWLPFYIGSIPFGAWFLDKIARRFKNLKVQILFLSVIILAAGSLSIRIVFYGKGEGLVYVLRELKRYEVIRREVLAATPSNSIIISDKSDKIFFPQRHVIVGTNLDSVISSLWELNKIGPLYLYAIAFNEDDPRFGAYQSAGFPLREEMRFGNERLYKLAPH